MGQVESFTISFVNEEGLFIPGQRVDRDVNLLLEGYVNIKATGETMKLPARTYQYPFDFQIPTTCPPSFDGVIGRVQYFVKAKMHRTWPHKNIEEKHFFNVHNSLDLKDIPTAFVVQYPSKQFKKNVSDHRIQPVPKIRKL